MDKQKVRIVRPVPVSVLVPVPAPVPVPVPVPVPDPSGSPGWYCARPGFLSAISEAANPMNIV